MKSKAEAGKTVRRRRTFKDLQALLTDLEDHGFVANDDQAKVLATLTLPQIEAVKLLAAKVWAAGFRRGDLM